METNYRNFATIKPLGMIDISPVIKNIFYNPITIHFIYRGPAYLLFLLVIIGWFKSKAISGNPLFAGLWLIALLLLVAQVLLGIFTVLNSMYAVRLVVLGVSQQFVGILLVMVITSLLFITRRKAL